MNTYKKILGISVAIGMVVASMLVWILPRKDFSENENRMLQELPEYRFENLINATFGQEVEQYVSDHFPFRDNLVAAKTQTQALIGYRELNGVFLAQDRLLQHIEMPDTTKLIERTNLLCDNLSDTDAEVYLMVVPTDAQVYRSELPKYAPEVVDEEPVIKSIYEQVKCKTVDVLEKLKKAKNEGADLYYHLDHHWNYDGAYVAYTTLCDAMNQTPQNADELKPVCVTNSFKGSLYSKVLLESMKPDEIYAPTEKEEIVVNYVDKNEKKTTYYNDSFLEQKDKYCYFGSGNQALMTIENKSAENDKELVIVKDSFANSFIPFLIKHYKMIHVIDPRYYRPHISDYVKQKKNVADVLLLYNVDSMNINNGIARIK